MEEAQEEITPERPSRQQRRAAERAALKEQLALNRAINRQALENYAAEVRAHRDHQREFAAVQRRAASAARRAQRQAR